MMQDKTPPLHASAITHGATSPAALTTIIVLSYNKFSETTGPCIRSLADDPDFTRWEVVVVDNASDPATRSSLTDLARIYPRLRLILNDANLGFAGGMNLGMRQARGDVFILLNSDTIVPPGMVGRIASAVRRNAQVGLLGPVTNAAGNEQGIFTSAMDYQVKISEGLKFSNAGSDSSPIRAYRLDFCCVALRRDVYQAVGDLDEDFGRGYYEDFDYSLRVANAGFDLAILEDAFIYHQGSASFNDLGEETRNLIARNKAILMAKHGTDICFPHSRDANLSVLDSYLRMAQAGQPPPPYRLSNRLALAKSNRPRSLWKRWRYDKRVTQVERPLLELHPGSAALAMVVSQAQCIDGQGSKNHHGPAGVCRICGGALKRGLRVREMMFGTREEFSYHQCANCACLQIDVFPEDIARYYPADYYSYDLTQHNAIKRLRRGSRRRLILTAPAFVSRSMHLFSGSDDLFHLYRNRLGVGPASRLLDVGSGSGAHVFELREAGVTRAFGVDPYVPRTVEADGMPVVYKARLDDLTGSYDFITFHHSLEHMPDQKSTLRAAARLLAPGGKILIRVPTVSSEAYARYGADWVSIDAPRHFFLHSHRSLRLLASSANLVVNELWCDSDAMQFMASEQYRENIPLLDPQSAARDGGKRLFSLTERTSFKLRAVRLNRQLRGDSICAVLCAIQAP